MLTEQEEYCYWVENYSALVFELFKVNLGNLSFKKKFMHYSLSVCSITMFFPCHRSHLRVLSSESWDVPDGPRCLCFPVARGWAAFRAIYAFPAPPFPPQEVSRCMQGSSWSPGGPAAWAGLLGWARVSHSLSLRFFTSLLSALQHFNLVSACHTQVLDNFTFPQLWSFSQRAIILNVCYAINYENCDWLIDRFLDSEVNWQYPCAVFPSDNLDCSD